MYIQIAGCVKGRYIYEVLIVDLNLAFIVELIQFNFEQRVKKINNIRINVVLNPFQAKISFLYFIKTL